MRVLMITQKVDSDDDILGFTHTWVSKLAERVDKLYVLALAVGRHSPRENFELFSMGKERGNSKLERLVNFNRVLARLVLTRKVDLVFIHMCPRYAILAAPYAKLMQVPMVMWFTHRSVNNQLRIAHWLVDKVVTASKESFRLRSDKVVITGHGMGTDRFKPLDTSKERDTKVILSVGRISLIKDYETLLEAADILVNQWGQQDLRFVVVGDAGTPEQVAYREQLLAEMWRRGLTDNFEFVGAVPHQRVVEHYQQVDLFLNLSHRDGLDKAVLEAMACGVVPLTSNPAFGPLLGTLAPHLMLAARDSCGVADKIHALLDLAPEERTGMGRKLRMLVEDRHSADGLMERLA